MSPASYRLHLLGPPRLEGPDRVPIDLPVGKPFALLVYLHVTRAPLTRDQAARIFWPGATPERARGSVRQAIWLIRNRIGRDVFVGEDPLVLAAGLVTSDLAELRADLDRSETTRALSRWEGTPFSGLAIPDAPEWERWADALRSEVEERLGSALAQEARRDRQGGRTTEGVRKLDRAREIEPERLRHHLELAEAQLDLRAFDRALEVLRNARRRFDGGDARERLRALEERVETVRRGFLTGTEEAALRLGFTGRKGAFTALVERWRQATQGQASVGVITGEVGMGKSRLLEEIGLLASAEGGRVVRVQAEDSERSFEWGVLGEIVRALFALSGAAGISRASDGLLKALVPSLSTGETTPAEVPQGGVRSTRTRPSAALADALHDLITAVSEDSPLLLIVDDLQWADAESRAVLARVASRLWDSPVLLLVASRTGAEHPGIAKTLSVLAEAPRATEIELPRWNREEVSEALAWMTRFPGPEEGERLIERIYLASRGNPFFVMELLRVFRNEGILEIPPRGGWIFRVERMQETLPLPESLRKLIDQELRQLSARAGAICRTLAESEVPRTPEELAAATGLREPELRMEFESLLERRIVTRRRDGRLALAHEGLRLAVLDFAWSTNAEDRPRTYYWTSRRIASVAAVLVGFVSLSAYLYSGVGAEPTVPLYGGGAIFFLDRDEVVEVQAPAAHPNDWERETSRPWVPSGYGVRGPFRTTDGALHWFENRKTSSEPHWIVDLGEDGEESVPVRSNREEDLRSISPNGEFLLYTAENRSEAGYREDLWVSNRDGTEARLLHPGADLVLGGSWSMDGRRIAFGVQGPSSDTVLVIAPDGSPVARHTVGRLMGLDWCGTEGELSMAVRQDGLTRVVLWHPEEARLETLPMPGELSGLVACSPDAAAVAFQAALEGEAGLFVFDRESGAVDPIPVTGAGGVHSLRWVPDRLPPIPVGIQIRAEDPIRLDWGARQALVAEILYSDGRRTPGEVDWVSRDPGTASVNADGVVTANQSGSTHILAHVDGWLTDSVPLLVIGDAHPGTLLRDGFETLDLSRWHLLGDPVPIPDEFRGSPILRLRGDGRFWDGVISRAATPLPQGGTLEGEFLLHLTAPDGQEVRLCLLEGDPPPPSTPQELLRNLEEWSLPQEACIRYPSGRRARRDASAAEFWTHGAFPPVSARATPHLPGTGWFHLAITLRPDGTAQFFVNREFLGSATPRLQNGEDIVWRIGVFGAALDTDALVRNLTLWPGVRY